MGFDDLAAILTIAAQPELSIAGLSLVAGNAPLHAVADTAARAAAYFGWTMAIHRGADRPLVAPLATAGYVLGPTGIASTGRTLPAARAAFASHDAVAAMARHVQESAAAEILAIGPLTNVALLLRAYPALVSRIAWLTWMGGSLGSGNHGAVAEFNAAVDPEAVEVVLSSGVAMRMVGLEPCRAVTVGRADVQALRAVGSHSALLLADLLDAYVRIAGPDGSRPMALYDPTAAAAVADARCLDWERRPVAVERAGKFTRGMTVVDRRRLAAGREAPIEVAVRANPERVRALVLKSLHAQLHR